MQPVPLRYSVCLFVGLLGCRVGCLSVGLLGIGLAVCLSVYLVVLVGLADCLFFYLPLCSFVDLLVCLFF